ncbi:XRE family transcriptional regulator [Pseudonocardia adelaidensis]|uniref:Helix-turn-helix transcriptional regulator n=1 Tax=Pseudonocardia adelaidensis TaxID=648754 RepID=A0ABP9NTB4_9PSEU
MADATSPWLIENQERQRELYGAPLGERVRRLTGALGISQARLARTLGMSPAMLSQLVSARRVKIGDPAVLARMLLLDQRCHALRPPADRRTVDALLAEIAEARWHWNGQRRPAPRTAGHRVQRPGPDGTAAAVLRGVADPARLAAAAAALGPAFPELAEVLRQAASRPGS